ncbi:MAG: hypothetical protein RL660_1146 [Bacteroidota bacterium]|jgi:hypothetical protein
MKKINFIAVILLFMLAACEKEVDLDLDNKSGQLVIEGNISNMAEPHTVRITRSVSFTQTNQYPPVTDAVVVITDNINLHDTLTYITDGYYITNGFAAGASGRNYTLTVLTDGKTYTAQSQMPEMVPLNGLKVVTMTNLGVTSYDVLPEYTDPPTLGNFYGFAVTASSQGGVTFESESDNIGNGSPNQRGLEIPSREDSPIKPGDTITVEMRSIAPEIYNYFTALEQIAGNGVLGGTTPANPPSNITGGALGYFSAHTKQVRSVIVP